MEEKKYFLILCLMLFSSFLLSAQEQTLPSTNEYFIQADQRTQTIPPLKWIIKEGTQALNPEELNTGNLQNGELIEPSEDGRFPFVENQVYWFQLKLRSEVALKDWKLDIGFADNPSPFILTYGEVNAYFFKNGKIIKQGKSGSSIPSSQRDIKNIFIPSLISLDISPNESISIWIQIHAIEKTNSSIPVSIIDDKVDTATIYIALEQAHYLLGAIIAILIIGFFLLIWFREKVYLWFLIFLLSQLISTISWFHQNEITYLFFSESPHFRPLFLAAGDMTKFMVLILFARIFIDTKQHFPKIDRLLLWSILPFPIVIILSLGNVNPVFANIFTGILTLCILTIIGIFIYLIFSKNKVARFFSFGAISTFIGIITVSIGKDFNLDPIISLGNYFIIFGPTITITLALAYRFRLITLEREKAQQAQIKIERTQADQLRQINIASAKFVPSTFLNFLGKKNILDATLGDYVEKQVTVLFSDIRDYTTLSEQMTPEENFRFVNAYNKRMGPIIQKHQGFVNQYLGDGIMAIFPENTGDTLQAAIEMQQNLHDYNQNRICKNKIPIRMGIGIHAGPLIMGIIGDDQRMDAATISDTVNAASRIEGLTKYFEVNILLSESCVNKLPEKEKFNLRYLGLVQLKGKEEAVKIYECFDGDAEDIISLKKETLVDFEKGLELYFSRKFGEAENVFKNILAKNTVDKSAALFLKKAIYLKNNSIDAAWTGVERMLEK